MSSKPGVARLPECLARLRQSDPTLKWIDLSDKFYAEQLVSELVDCLLACPNAVVSVDLGRNQLTDSAGLKLAHFVAGSSTVRGVYSLGRICPGERTLLAMAWALRTNTSLRELDLNAMYSTRAEEAFANALRVNPLRPAHSEWCLYSRDASEFSRLKKLADQLGHPSMQTLLRHWLGFDTIEDVFPLPCPAEQTGNNCLSM